MRRRHVILGTLVITGSMAIAVPAHAQAPAATGAQSKSFGVRAGVSASPDQVFIGGHVESPRLGITQHLSLRPNVEIGFGDEEEGGTTLAVNFEVLSWLPFPNSPWNAYVGGGPALGHTFGDFPRTAGGANVVIGVQHRSGYFVEVKAGGGNVASFKATAGYVFQHR